MVSAWASENGLALGQVKTEEKSNEITAIPELLEVPSVSGCIVTIDAMGCQRNITEAIVDQGADYVLALKGNQGELRADTEAIFERLRESESKPPHVYQSATGGHDRVETRRCWAVDVEEKGRREGWQGLRTVCLVECERFEDGEAATKRRYFVSSLQADAERLLEATRRHWHIENKMHWVLDVAFGEDQSRLRAGHAARNMATVRRLALGLLEQEESLSVGVKNKRLRAGWDHGYLERSFSRPDAIVLLGCACTCSSHEKGVTVSFATAANRSEEEAEKIPSKSVSMNSLRVWQLGPHEKVTKVFSTTEC